MPHESFRHLRTDRRLLDRRGWISSEELSRELEGLPDVSDKIASPEERDAEAGTGDEPAAQG